MSINKKRKKINKVKHSRSRVGQRLTSSLLMNFFSESKEMEKIDKERRYFTKEELEPKQGDLPF